MTRSRSIRRILASLVALGLLSAGVAGCPQSKEVQVKKAEAKWEGTYDSTSAKETLQILSDHKAVMRNENGPADLTWEPTDQAGKFILHAPFPVEFFRTDDGGLRDATGVVWKKKG